MNGQRKEKKAERKFLVEPNARPRERATIFREGKKISEEEGKNEGEAGEGVERGYRSRDSFGTADAFC